MQQLFSFTKDDMLRGIELGVIALLTLIVLLTVVRPLMRQILGPDILRKSQPALEGGDPNAAMMQLPNAPDGQPMLGAPRASNEPETPSERMLAMAQIKGQIKAQSVEKIGGMVRQNPSDSVAVLRTWVHEPAGGAA
jgi:flagellar M-ring protein FliF